MFKNLIPSGLGFIFDIIIVHINFYNINNPDISKIKVNVKFNKNSLKITSSRINVGVFKPKSGFEFKEQPLILKEQLYKNPLECTIYYDGKSMGNCSFLWPENVINFVDGDCAREITHCDTGDIKNEDGKVGKIEIFVRLEIKCHEFEEKEIIKPEVNLCNRADTSVIDPHDVLFVLGEDKSQFIACNDVNLVHTSETNSSATSRTCLDLSEFKHINGKSLTNTDILNSMDTSCCKSKKISNQYQQMIDNLIKKAQQIPCCSKNQSKNEQWNFPYKKETNKPVDCLLDSRFASCSSSESYNLSYCISDENAFEDKNIVCQKDDVAKKSIERYCPLCHNNITWLPKFGACPKCGFKPILYNVEKPYNYKITADKILQEYVNKEANNKKDLLNDYTPIDSIGNSKYRCTCRDGKICAHCRIKKLCEDIFKTFPKTDEDCGKCEVKSSEMYSICKTSSYDCRPHLAKVLEALKDLYETKELKTKNINTVSTQEQCQNTIQHKKILPVHPLNNHNILSVERKHFIRKNFNKHEACKGKVFDYRSQRNYPGNKIGHKTCLNGYAGRKNVPRNMGWLWNAEAKGLRTGYKPGAIRKPIKVLMQHFLKRAPQSCYTKLCKVSDKGKDEEEDYTKKPTLHICKRNGVYYITLRGLNDIQTVKECSDHYVNMKSIEFKITKNPFLIEIRKLKQYLKSIGFAKCVCHKPISFCSCRSFLDKKKLKYQCDKECQRRHLNNCCETLVLSDTSDSEGEFDFGVTPPAGVIHPEKCIKKNRKISTATQYEENDWRIKEYSKPLTKYFKLHNCAVGERFGKAFGPYGIRGYRAGAVPLQGVSGPCVNKADTVSDNRGRRGKGIPIRGPGAFLGSDDKFSMAQYLAVKALTKPTSEEIGEKKRKQMALLKGGNPPLLCGIDRRGKPVDIYSTYIPLSCDRACLHDNRIC